MGLDSPFFPNGSNIEPMRTLISVLAMLVVGLLATQAKADLVDDLRSGRSDIKAAPSKVFEVRHLTRLHEELQSKSNYRAMAAQWYSPYGSWSVYGAHSAEAAVRDAVRQPNAASAPTHRQPGGC